ncbi:MAG: hypothetical protein KGL77_05075 [Actinomycetales bacterium]|nr:hypothetical protein [Actinomycetales bacterium]
MKKAFKRNAIAAAGAATILSLVMASPSLAHSNKGQTAAGATTGTSQSQPFKQGTFGQLAATVTGVPSTVTDARGASRGAYFTVYVLDAAATAVPATQPTTGGIRLDIRGGTLANATLSGNIPLKGGAASSTTKYAIYPSTGGAAIFATVTVDANSVATVTSSAALTATYDATTAASAPAFGPGGKGGRGDMDGDRGKGPKGDKGKGPKGQPGLGAPAGISASVTVPADGKTYSIKVTETAEKGVAVTNPVARPAMPVTGTGAQTVKLPLGPSDTYKIELVAADGTVVSTVTVTVAADGTVTTPIVLG